MDHNMKVFLRNMMGYDESDQGGLEKNGSEWSAMWQYSMNPDGSWRSILGQKLTECIETWRFKYGMWW